MCFTNYLNKITCLYCGEAKYDIRGLPYKAFDYLPIIHQLRLPWADSTHELQIIKEPAEVQKERFKEEMEVVKEQLQKIEAKSMRLDKELSFFKAKEQKSGQHKGKDT